LGTTVEELNNEIRVLNNEIRVLKDQTRDLIMRLSAIKVIVTRINPVCAEKLQQLLDTCGTCNIGD